MTEPLLNRIDNLEKSAKFRNIYDEERVMRDIERNIRLKKMRGMSEKNLEEKRKLEEEKLKLMEEKREELLSSKIKKIEEKMKERERILSSRPKQLIKSTSLPPINVLQMNIDRIKEEELDNCYLLNDKLLEKYENHKINYEGNNKEKNLRYLLTDKRYDERHNRYKKKVAKIEKEKIEEYNKQQIENCYNIKECFERHKNPKIREMKERNKKHLEELKDRQYEIMLNDEKRKKEILKKLNYIPSGFLDEDKIQFDYIHRENLSHLQKEKLEKIEKERIKKYKWYLLKQKDAFRFATEENKEDNRIKKLSQQQTLLTQMELDKKFEELNKCMKELEEKSILRKDKDERLKLFYEKHKELKSIK